MPEAVISGSAQEEGHVDLLFNKTESSASLGENDRVISRMLWGMLTKSKAWKGNTEFADADENWDFWNSKQWRRQRAPSLTMAVINEVYPTVETFLGHLSDNIPDPICHPRDISKYADAQKATKLLNWSDDVNDVTASVHSPVRSTLITGMGVWRIDWSMSMERGRGAPKYTYIDENCFFVNAWALMDPETWQYCIEAQNVPIEYVRKNWAGKRGEDVRPGTMDNSLTPLPASPNKGGNGMNDAAAWTTTDTNETVLTRSGGKSDGPKDLVTLIQAYIKQDDGTIRYVVVANGIVLEDGPSPYDDDEFPYVVFNVIPDRRAYTGKSLAGVIKKLQMMLNEEASYELDQQRFESDSPLVVRAPNLREGKTITNAPGTILPDLTDSGNGYYMLTKPGANPRWGDMQGRIVQKIREITGNVDVLRGEHPAGVSTLGALEILRDEANVLVNKMVKEILRGLKRKNMLTLNRIAQFMKDERVIRIVGKGGKAEFVTVNERTSMGPDGEYAVANAIPSDFEVDLDFSPSAPGGSEARFERALTLAKTPAQDGLPMVDRQYVLESIDEDQQIIDALMQRLDDEKNQQAQAQQQQQQADQAAKGGVPPQQDPAQMDEHSLAQKAMEIFGGIAA